MMETVQGMMLRGPANLDPAKVNRIVNELLATVTSHLVEILLLSTGESRDVIDFIAIRIRIINYRGGMD